MLVKDLESRLFARFPLSDAEPWDHVGLSVGDPEAQVAGVACALDPTPAHVEEAAARGANVLITHHPVYLKAPDTFSPAPGASTPMAAATSARRSATTGLLYSMATGSSMAQATPCGVS